MNIGFLNQISPFVRTVKILKSYSLSGQWLDKDNIFTYIHSGEADFILDGVKYHLKEGDALIMFPFLSHIINSSTTELVQYIFHFDLFHDKSTPLQKNDGIHHSDKPYIPPEKEMFFKNIFFVSCLNHTERSALEKSFMLMNKEYKEQREGYELATKASAIDILLLILRSNNKQKVYDNSKKAKSWFAIDKALHYINDNLKKNLDIEEISEFVNLTPNYLSAAFKKEIGVSLHQYVNSVRIENAKKLIQAGDLNFSQIAIETGFSNIYSFCKVFKRITDMTATEYQVKNLGS